MVVSIGKGGRVYAFYTLPAAVRIEPETLNLKSKGKFTAVITLPEGYDVADINVSTVECEGASALSATISATDNGTLVAKFDREDLRVDLPTGEVEMTVTGELTDGTKFDGSDTVRVIAKGA
jgi:FKBP-type peptidyl-prolyl cis-trans isomerase